MSRLNDIMNEADETVEAANETVSEVGGTEGQAQADNSPSAVEPQSEQVGSDVKVDETPKSKQPKQQYTPEQRAEYAFRKRLDRQRQKYDSQIDELKKQIEALTNPKTPKTRQDFASDEEYVKDYFQQMIDAAFKQKESEQQRQYEINAKQAGIVNDFVAQVERDYGSMDEYNQVVETSLENGLGELISNNPSVKQFIQNSAQSAKVLYALATDQNAVNKIFGARSEWDMFYELKRLEERLSERSGETAKPVEQAKPSMQAIGKVGSNNNVSNENWDDASWLRRQIRSH